MKGIKEITKFEAVLENPFPYDLFRHTALSASR